MRPGSSNKGGGTAAGRLSGDSAKKGGISRGLGSGRTLKASSTNCNDNFSPLLGYAREESHGY